MKARRRSGKDAGVAGDPIATPPVPADRSARPPTPPPPPPLYDRATEKDATDVDETTIDRDDERRNGRDGDNGGPGGDRTVIIDPTKLQ